MLPPMVLIRVGVCAVFLFFVCLRSCLGLLVVLVVSFVGCSFFACVRFSWWSCFFCVSGRAVVCFVLWACGRVFVSFVCFGFRVCFRCFRCFPLLVRGFV